MDDNGFHLDWITELEEVVAALARQYDRAIAAGDERALAVEGEAIADRIRNLVFHHFAVAIGVTSDNWVWPSGTLDGWSIERPGPMQLSAAGQISCGLPEGGTRDYWQEPCSAYFQLVASGGELTGYTIRFGRRATLLDLASVRPRVLGGDPPKPCLPSEVSEWAYEFTRQFVGRG